MNLRDRLARAIGPVEGLHLRVAGAALLGMAALTTADVIARKALSAPLAGAMELTELLMGVLVFAALPVVSSRGEHIAFDALSDVLSPRARHWQNVLANVLAACAWVLLGLLLVEKSQALRAYGDATPEFKLPMWIFIAGAGAFTFVAGVAHLTFLLTGRSAENKEVL
jgi:TRAP-type C4-dicarboxylate transport system permease small subunit